MDALNDDCILYICKFLNTQEKIQLLSTCKRFYNLIEFKNDVVVYNKQTKKWVKKYKPLLIFHSTKNINCYKIYELILYMRNLSYLPNFDTTFITKLDISANNFSTIPNEIYHMTNLQDLNMNTNESLNRTKTPSIVFSAIDDLLTLVDFCFFGADFVFCLLILYYSLSSIFFNLAILSLIGG